MPNRTTWLIDGSYLFLSAKNKCKLDYLKLKEVLLKQISADGFNESHYFNAIPQNQTDQSLSFHRWLQSASPIGPKINTHLYTLKNQMTGCWDCGAEIARPVQKGVDVGIATLILTMAFEDKYDTLVLLSGDGDLKDAVHYVRNRLGKRVIVAGFGGSVSTDLQCQADAIVWLDEHIANMDQS